MTDTELPDAVYGVDFSAAADDAGRNTWIAECEPRDDRLVVDRLADAAEFLECAPDRESTLDRLVDLVTDGTGERRAFGLDFPFGLPAVLLAGDDWREFVEGTVDGEWGVLGDVAGPRSLYDGAEDHAEPREDRLRETDEEHGGQEPTGFRIKTQTYYGISRLLAEVADAVSVVPMDDPAGGPGTVVLETYPAAVFRTLADERDGEVYDAGYKRDTRESIERRQANVGVLQGADVEFDEHREMAVASDDALDAVAAAYATWRAAECGYSPDDLPSEPGETDRPYAVEGYIYC